MKISFKKVHIENFLSFGNADFEIDNLGYVLVSGRNTNITDSATSNGSGKSALFDSILWCLTGETIRGSKDVVNLFGSDGSLVELTFRLDRDEFVVTRTKNHSKYKSNLFVYRNGENVSGKGIRDTEVILKDYLGDLTPSTISSVIILGQGLPQRFTNNTPSARKEILEKLSKSDFMIEDLKNRVNSRRVEVSSQKRAAEDNLLANETTLKLKKQELSKLEQNVISEDDIKSLEESISKLTSDVKEFSIERDIILNDIVSKELEYDSLHEITDKLSKTYYDQIRKIDSEYQNHSMSFLQEQTSLNQEYRNLSLEISKIDNMRDTCPTCGQKLVNFVRPDKTPYIESQMQISAKLNSLKEKILFLENTRNKEKEEAKTAYDSDSKSVLQKQAELKEYIKSKGELERSFADKIKQAEIQINSNEINLKNLKNALATRENDIKNLSTEIEKIEETLLYIHNDIDELNERASIISNMETILKRDFRGVLLESVIEYIDSKMKEYSEVVFGNRNILFQLDGNSISITFNGKEYENLSGGEKQKVDLIIQFAIRSMLVMQTGFNCNIIVLDEIFDNLDAIGSEKVLDLISAKLNDVENIFIVTHHSSIPIPYDKEVTIQKGDDNLSVIL